ncbi:hypothetical protein N7539_003645 [Penicillium diatomitis]|uniref:S-adenosyl-L-methionine-dependent methyltransferase n=1 Tax=Penicillium diatomitis TaxID=2819901 RepID=A0A9X0BXH1_9EURO|nr:uncharacterized protein N7539_003645 [Penicillium diatomitis]KAJ5488755.1 hypothetical protein N7539_003645 [Penicillium diatomitis]
MSQPNPNESIQIDTSDDDSLVDTKTLIDSNLSFASSVRDYCYENGRRYHAYRHGQYPFPNDEEEQARLALMHHLFKMLSGGDLFRAPFTRNTLTQSPQIPSRILDIGTGTAEWATEMAEDFPTTTILGTDLSPIQPAWAPPNCRFFIDDAESDWTFSPSEAFDYIHVRSLGGGIADWPRLLRQAYTHLKPGGWFEAQEFETFVLSDDGTHARATRVLNWQDQLNHASNKFGKPMNVAPRLSGWLEDAGFVNVADDIYKCPVGGWAKNRRLKEIGRVGKVTILEVVEPYTLALFTRVLGFSYQDALEYMEKVRAELMSNKFHLYVLFHFVYGQKPLDAHNPPS